MLFFSGVIQYPLEIKLEYLKDDDFVLPTSTEVLVNQQNIIQEVEKVLLLKKVVFK